MSALFLILLFLYLLNSEGEVQFDDVDENGEMNIHESFQ
jgi:hypothetical protein